MHPAIGYAIDERRHEFHLQHPPFGGQPIEAVEIPLDDPSLAQPGARRPNGEFEWVSLRAPGLSLFETALPSGLASLRTTAGESGAQALSGQIGLSESSARVTRPALKAACRRVDRLQQHFAPLRFYVQSENGRSDGSPARHETAALATLLKETGCGWLLDITSLAVHAHNFGQSAYDLIEEVIPNAAMVQLHISGIACDGAWDEWFKSEAAPIPEAVLELYAFLLEMAIEKVDAVFIERQPDAFDAVQLRDEYCTVREIAEGVAAIAYRGTADLEERPKRKSAHRHVEI